MPKGYRLVETHYLDQLIISMHFEIAVSIMFFIIEKLNNTIVTKYDSIELEVIKVTRHKASYPCIGIYHIDPNDLRYLEPEFMRAIDEILEHTPMSDFLDFYENNHENMRSITKKIMSE